MYPMSLAHNVLWHKVTDTNGTACLAPTGQWTIQTRTRPPVWYSAGTNVVQRLWDGSLITYPKPAQKWPNQLKAISIGQTHTYRAIYIQCKLQYTL